MAVHRIFIQLGSYTSLEDFLWACHRGVDLAGLTRPERSDRLTLRGDDPPRANAGPPPRPLLDAAIRRFVSQYANASNCAEQPPVRGETRWECTTTECPGGCQVVRVITVLGERRGRFRRVTQRREHLGDTGECGCCMF